MSDSLRIFIGSSKEAEDAAKDIQSLIFEEAPDVAVLGWWTDGVFPVGSTFIESLEAVMKKTNAAILVASEDDRITQRGALKTTPRDNVTFECGMAVAHHGRQHTAVAVVGTPELPSDLSGVSHLSLSKGPGGREKNRGEIRKLLVQWKAAPRKQSNSVEVVLPALYAAMLRVLSEVQARAPQARLLDAAAAGLLESIAKQFTDRDTHTGITQWICAASAGHLTHADAIWAVDVLGPSAWLKPTAFRYLAIQIREYLRANVVSGRWALALSSDLADAIRRASTNIAARTGKESATEFDDQFFLKPGELQEKDFSWTEGSPTLEFARILLWTEDELRSPITESVIAIHEAFHVPLFALVVNERDDDRSFDFIAFRQRSGAVKGFYNVRQQGFVPRHITDDRVPEHGRCSEQWKRLLSHPDLMFAADLYAALDGQERAKLFT